MVHARRILVVLEQTAVRFWQPLFQPPQATELGRRISATHRATTRHQNRRAGLARAWCVLDPLMSPFRKPLGGLMRPSDYPARAANALLRSPVTRRWKQLAGYSCIPWDQQPHQGLQTHGLRLPGRGILFPQNPGRLSRKGSMTKKNQARRSGPDLIQKAEC